MHTLDRAGRVLAGPMQDVGTAHAQPVVYRLPQPAYHVWTIDDMQILNELHNPVAIVVYGGYENPHRSVHLLCFPKGINGACPALQIA